ncbi:MAG: GGDEF domain-containing protein [Patulibacter minatonensis]
MATTDELTQVHNRRHFFELGDTQFLTAQRYDLPLATLMLDVDHFKRVNDTYGHAAGDDVIRGVAARLHALIRTVDIVGRYGGEEFAFVLPCTGDDATILAERLRSAVASEPVDTCEGPITVTVSIGVAVYDHDDAHLSATLGRADLALYEAKRLGRNRVELAHEGGERR